LQIEKDTWNNPGIVMDEEEQKMHNIYITQGASALSTYIGNDTAKINKFTNLRNKIDNEIIRRQAALKGVTFRTNNTPITTTQNNMFNIPPWMSNDAVGTNKYGGIIYKARISARGKDNDRTKKAIKTSKQIA
jgi:hypothetical protein